MGSAWSVLHEPAPALEQVRPAVGGVDLVADLARQRCLRHLSGMIRLLGRPVPKARPEAVRHGRDSQLSMGHIDTCTHRPRDTVASGPFPMSRNANCTTAAST